MTSLRNIEGSFLGVDPLCRVNCLESNSRSVTSLTKRTGDLGSFRTLRGVLLSPAPLERSPPGSRVQKWLCF